MNTPTKTINAVIAYKDAADAHTTAVLTVPEITTDPTATALHTALQNVLSALSTTFPWITEISPTLDGTILSIEGTPTTPAEKAAFTTFTTTLATTDPAALYTLLCTHEATINLIPENHRI